MVDRGAWGHKLHFLFTCIGFATGLGNLWRFPGMAYENGGGSFVIPYICASLILGFPLLYMELSIGQFTRRGPAKCFKYFMPVLQGIGWASAVVAYVVGIYYQMINVYSAVYIGKTLTGNSDDWVTCRNDWNTPYCESTYENSRCASESAGNHSYFSNGSCWDDSYRKERRRLVELKTVLPPVSAAEEFFERYVNEKSGGFDDFGGFNLKILIGYFLVWALTAVTLVKGVELIGKISTVTATVPFVIIAAIFVRAITLDGAELGIQYFVTKPDLSRLLDLTTWEQAAIQICYTLAIGFGGLLSLSSYNPPNHNCFRDALIVIFFDSFMSVFGGSAAFCTMGFMSNQTGLPLNELLQSGTSLSFVAYPQALHMMPLNTVWTFFFFLMFFCLGVTSQFGQSEVMCTAICDQIPRLHQHKAVVAVAVCFSSFLLGLPLCTRAGIYWFNLLNQYAGTFALFAIAFSEVLTLAYLYGLSEYEIDLHNMMGKPVKFISRWFGPSGKLILLNFKFISPIVLAILFVVTAREYIGFNMSYGSGARQYFYPPWANIIGWIFAVAPLATIPVFAVINIAFYAKKNRIRDAFSVHPKLPSYERLTGAVYMGSPRTQKIADLELK